MVKQFLSKSNFSTYLRSQCDRQLYLSLFSKDPVGLAQAGIPIPLKTRPGVQLQTQSGREFEMEQFDKLVTTIPGHIVCKPTYSKIDLHEALQNPPDPAFILQPALEPEEFRAAAFQNLGLTQEEADAIPELSGLRPDVLYVHKPTPGDYEVLSDGTRRFIPANETRHAISVIDMKNVTEANPSYSAEVCLYAFFLANWLENDTTGLKTRYYVSHKVYLWKHIEMPHFEKMLTSKDGTSAPKRIGALVIDLNDGLVDFLIFMPSVKKFFKEDIPRVIQQGNSHGWNTVSYHVNPKCGGCDWLGNTEWLRGDDVAIYQAHPEHYCLHSAEISDHLCKMSGLSRGASSILTSGGKTRIADLVDIAGTDPVLKLHAFLKKDKSQIGEKAKAIATGVSTVDETVKIGGLAAHLNAEYDIIVNFDSGAGLLTGIAVRGILFFPYGQTAEIDGEQVSFMSFREEAFVVNKDNSAAEWASLLSFITRLSSWINRAEELFQANGWGTVSTQICFWEQRQYLELCNAFSRHLLDILTLADRQSRAMAWIFPAEELLEKDEQVAPGIVFIKDVIEAATRLSVKFSNTLLGVAENYHYGTMPPRRVDTYYREPLGNAIPRERIFEIWKCTSGVVPMYGRPASLNDAITKYGDILKAQAWALTSVTARLRTDLRERLQSKAPSISLSIGTGARAVAYDSKLWIQWDEVEASTSETENKLNLISKAEKLEAAYKGIVLTQLLEDLGGHLYKFEVSEESTEAKIEEGDSYLVLGLVNNPGFPLMTGAKFGLTPNPPQYDHKELRTPLHKVILVTLHQFDRVNKVAVIRIQPRWRGVEGVFNELFDQGFIPILEEPICLMEGMPYNDSKTTRSILLSVGNPANAEVAGPALIAMGNASKRLPQGSDTVTPLSRVLWDAKALADHQVRTHEEAEAIANFASDHIASGLNESQKATVYECSRNQLSVVWGPPGTGKTKTLSALIYALVQAAKNSTTTKKILITGPNYRAVEELAERVLLSLNGDSSCAADVFWVYSQSREPKIMPDSESHLNARSFNLKHDQDSESELAKSIRNANRVTIVATTAHAIPNITKLLYGRDTDLIKPLFDLVVIDESSQVQLTLALRPLSLLKPTAQLVVAGDHLQMPPIASLDPPKNAEYLVGSIQTYLLERFPDLSRQVLLTNYRSNEDLVSFAKTLGYPSELRSNDPGKSVQLIQDPEKVIASLPDNLPKMNAYADIIDPAKKVITFIHDDIISSQANEYEAKIVAAIAFLLRYSLASELSTDTTGQEPTPFTDEDFFKSGLGVVTPHKAQKALVLRELRTLFPDVDPKIIFEAVDTVERFQGGERQTVIVSFGVGDTEIIAGEEGFLLQLERTNVAVSRAKAKCIVIMPKALAYHLPTDAKATETSRAIKSYIEEFCANRRQVLIADMYGEARNGEIRWH